MDKLAEEIFTKLLELDLHDREQFLDEAWAERHELRRLVEGFLSDAEKADDYFTSSFCGAPFVEVARNSMIEMEGDRVGPYKLLQQIGEGGFGVVWMAEQDKPISRRVAVKVIKAGMDTKEVLSRFDAERQALARMDHPNIARVLDAGATVTGRPYFAMELVKGIPITRFCDQEKLDAGGRLRLFTDVCAAINHAHQKGVIHRDIKPSNVLVTLDGGKPLVKVIDFGISKAIEGKLTDFTLFIRIEHWVGTPVYMSPEQAGLGSLGNRGQCANLDKFSPPDSLPPWHAACASSFREPFTMSWHAAIGARRSFMMTMSGDSSSRRWRRPAASLAGGSMLGC